MKTCGVCSQVWPRHVENCPGIRPVHPSNEPQYPEGPGFQKISETSRQAAKNSRDLKARKKLVYDAIAAAPAGLTADEACVLLRMVANQVAPTFTYLKKAGLIATKDGDVRPTRLGEMAQVYRVVGQ